MKKILVVDDDPNILEGLSWLLKENADWKVVTADKGEYVEALATNCPQLPDLILLDIQLKDKDGLIICRKLKEQKATAHIPIIMISALTSAKKKVYKFGANDFVAKPVDTKELLTKVEEHMN